MTDANLKEIRSRWQHPDVTRYPLRAAEFEFRNPDIGTYWIVEVQKGPPPDQWFDLFDEPTEAICRAHASAPTDIQTLLDYIDDLTDRLEVLNDEYRTLPFEVN